jgi:tetrapyrrole methylase family protein/MazG family protein
MAKIVICGLGPGGEGDITEATVAAINRCSVRYLRTSRHPSASRVPEALTFDHFYETLDTFDEVYSAIAAELKSAAETQGEVLYAVPGSPLVLERTVRQLLDDPEVDVELVPSLSFLDVLWARLGVDPVEEGVRLVDGHRFATEAAGERGPLLVAHTHANWVLSDIKLSIDAGPEQRAILCKAVGTPEEEIVEVAWPDLDRSIEADHLTSLYIPELAAPVGAELVASVELMHRLRQDCPWDQEQTHESLRRHLLEEAYEVLEAIDGVNTQTGEGYEHLEEELGDLWFQILFHAELASEMGQFTIADVARGVHDKLVSRHPHVFGDDTAADAAEVLANWEEAKIAEKGRQSVMDGIPKTLPALTFAEKVLKKAKRIAGVPTAEARNVSAVGLSAAPRESEVGALLLAVVEQARAADIDPEGALRAAATAARDRFMAGEQADSIPASWVFG